MSTQQLLVGQASQEFTRDPARVQADVAQLLGMGVDVWGFTEVRTFGPQLEEACRLRRYHLVLADQGDTAIAVRGDHTMEGHGEQLVSPGDPRPASEGGHGPRSVQGVGFRAGAERVSFLEAHWLTQRSDDGHQRLAMTRVMAELVEQAARGTRLAFWAGDTNNPDRPSAVSDVDLVLRKRDLTSCWDELGRYPATHGDATLDVVGSYDPDRRVSCTRARVFPQLHSDHRPLVATYSIRPLRPRH